MIPEKMSFAGFDFELNSNTRNIIQRTAKGLSDLNMLKLDKMTAPVESFLTSFVDSDDGEYDIDTIHEILSESIKQNGDRLELGPLKLDSAEIGEIVRHIKGA